jgi:hypothetical protein
MEVVVICKTFNKAGHHRPLRGQDLQTAARFSAPVPAALAQKQWQK